MLYPTEVIRSVYDIDFKALYDSGVRGLIFDIDNTLVPHGAPADERAAGLFEKIHGIGFGTFVLSNNKEPRVRSFCEKTGCRYIYKAGKPSAHAYIDAMREMNTDTRDTVSIGDQIFTDIWGSSNAGIRSIMVHRIAFREEIQIHLKRIPEAVIMFFYYHFPRKKDPSLKCIFGGNGNG